MLKYALTAASIVFAAPVVAQECIAALPAISTLAENGFSITFGDTSGEWALFMAEDGKGGWVVFALKDDILCPVASGVNGIHTPMPPNA